MNRVATVGQLSVTKFSGGTFSEQIAAAAVSLSGGKCIFKACPYPAYKAQILCQQHEKFFSYETSMLDRSVADHYRTREHKFTEDGLVIYGRKRSQQSREERVTSLYHRILGSAGILADCLRYMREAPPSQINDWKRNHFAAQELLELSRYPTKQPICPYCGWTDIHRYREAFALLYKCRLCTRKWSLTSRTIFCHSHWSLTMDKWVFALCILKENPHKGVAIELASKLGIHRVTSERLNRNVCICAETLGLQIGWTKRDSLRALELRQKLGLTAIARGPGEPSPLMTVAEIASHFRCSHGVVNHWIQSGLLESTMFRNLRLVTRKDVVAFRPPMGAARGNLVPAGPTLRLAQRLLREGFTCREIGWSDSDAKFVRCSTEQRVKAVYERLIQQGSRWIPSQSAKAMVQDLYRQGYTKAELCKALAQRKAVIDFGKRITVTRETRIRKVYNRLNNSSRNRWSPAARTWQLIQRLVDHGFSKNALGRLLGINHHKVCVGRGRILTSRAQEVEKLYRRLMARCSTKNRHLQQKEAK